MTDEIKKAAQSIDANKLKKQLLRKFGVRSEKEFIQKALGTSDIREAKSILLQKLNSVKINDPLLQAAKSRLAGAKRKLTESELNRILTPEQKRKLKQFLEQQRKKR